MPRGRLLAIALLLLTGLTAVPASAAEPPFCQTETPWGTLRADEPVVLNLSCQSFDGSRTGVTLAVLDEPDHGTVIDISPVTDADVTHRVTYEAAPGFTGPDSFTLQVADAVTSADHVVELELVPNRGPICDEDLRLHTEVGQAATTFRYCMDVNYQDGTLDFEVTEPPAHGTVADPTDAVQGFESGWQATYTPEPGFTGLDEYTVTASDGGLSEDVTVHVTVADGPWCTPFERYEIRAGKTGTFGAFCTQPDGAPGPLRLRMLDGPDQGTATPDGDWHSIEYTPFPSASGLDSFSYEAYSPAGVSNVVSQEWTILPNAAPACEGISTTTPADSSVAASLSCGDADEDPVTMAVDHGPEHGALSEITGGQVTYTPDPGFVGVDRFTYVGSDYARTSAPATVRITVDDGKAPGLELDVARGQSPREVARNGLGVYESSDEQVTATTEITVSRRTAKRLGLVRRGSGPVRIALDRSRFEWDVPVMALIHLTDRAATAIRKARRVPITVRFRGVDPLGNVAQVTRRVTLRR